jgi:heme exporter protein A
VSIARAVVHEPRVVLLDEPFTGLDEVGAAALTAALHELRASGATLVLVTHNLGEGLELGTHAAIMRDGRFVVLEPRPAVATADFARRYREVIGA